MHLKRSELEAICGELMTDFDGILRWKWDDRFEALLAEYSSENQEEVYTILERHFKEKWDVRSIRNAQDSVKTTTGFFSDLRSGQLLFTTDPESDAFIIRADAGRK